MNDSFAGDFNATQTTTAGAAAEQKAEGIAPVQIQQVLEAPEGNFQMFGMTFGMVSCVAIVRSIDMSSTKITYTLEDASGRIDAHYWLEEGDALKAPDVMLNNYVHVYGSVRSQGGRKTLMVFKLIPVTNPNELCTHLLEVLNARFKAEDFQKKPVGSATGGGISDFMSGNNKHSTGSIETHAGSSLGLEGKQLAVFQAIKSNRSHEGISRRELRSKFTHMNESELSKILDFMVAEGHIYSTIDPDHFTSTE